MKYIYLLKLKKKREREGKEKRQEKESKARQRGEQNLKEIVHFQRSYDWIYCLFFSLPDQLYLIMSFILYKLILISKLIKIIIMHLNLLHYLCCIHTCKVL